MSAPRRGGTPLGRGNGARTPHRDSLLVFSEGVSTEVGYLIHWHRLHRERILVEIDPTHGDPLTLVEAAVRRRRLERREQDKGRGEAHTEYWCVFDRDEHATFDAAVRLARREEIGLAVSNPCLELWFVWHFQDQTAYIERADAQRLSRKLLGCDKTLDTSALESLAEQRRYEAAKRRALRMDVRHEGDGSAPGSNPSSGMHALVDRIARGRREAGRG
jgi:RloB-like protein